MKIYIKFNNECDAYDIMVIDNDMVLYSTNKVKKENLNMVLDDLVDEFSDTGREVKIYR